ncbi:MAG: hypothetical protein AB7F82_04090 [Alphaproteobacteria bacterium]
MIHLADQEKRAQAVAAITEAHQALTDTLAGFNERRAATNATGAGWEGMTRVLDGIIRQEHKARMDAMHELKTKLAEIGVKEKHRQEIGAYFRMIRVDEGLAR